MSLYRIRAYAAVQPGLLKCVLEEHRNSRPQADSLAKANGRKCVIRRLR